MIRILYFCMDVCISVRIAGVCMASHNGEADANLASTDIREVTSRLFNITPANPMEFKIFLFFIACNVSYTVTWRMLFGGVLTAPVRR